MLRAFGGVVCAFFGVLAVIVAAAPQTAARSTPTLFEFRSAFWVNLHHYLHALGRNASPLFDDDLVTLKTQVIAAPSSHSLRGSTVRPEDATLLEAVAPV